MPFKPTEETRQRIKDQQALDFDKEQFVEDVFNENVILVVGKEVILDKQITPSGDVGQYILKVVNDVILPPGTPAEERYKDFNQLVHHSGMGHYFIRKILNDAAFYFDLNDLSPELRALLETRLFPLVLTTTFDGYLEVLMRSIWGDRLRVVNIDDKKTVDDFRNTLRGYRGKNRYFEPTLFYIFGKAVPDEKKSFVCTDDDAIKIVENWITLPKEDPILSWINNRKLLALGCKFDDWYFRFFWFILRRDISHFQDGQVAFLLDDNDASDKKLKRFLSRSRIYCHPDARQFMTMITGMLNSTETGNPFSHLVTKHRKEGGLFLSYCSEDVIIASRLFFQLTQAGFNVWFDCERLRGGDVFDQVIEKAILSSKVFIPILSSSVAADLSSGNTDRYYVKEWKLACQLGEKRIIPVAVNGYSFRKGDYHPVFEGIVGKGLTGIDLMEKDGYGRLIDLLTDFLAREQQYD